MPRSFRDYTWSDWQHLRPFTQTLKTLRYRAIDFIHMRRPSPSGDLASLISSVQGRHVLVTIAYCDPEVIAWQVPLVRRYVPQALHVVADNTPDDEQADSIERYARRGGALYLRLPKNPWGTGSRSHGIAMNWVWHNVLRSGKPAAFGFLDHDIFPLAPVDPFAILSAQSFHGMVRRAGKRWYLWAGFCFFRFDAVYNLPLDFGQDWFIGLDTGGGNWSILYERIKPFALGLVWPTHTLSDVGGREVILQWGGAWLHEGGWMWKGNFEPAKRAAVASILAPHLAAAEGCDSSVPIYPPRTSRSAL